MFGPFEAKTLVSIYLLMRIIAIVDDRFNLFFESMDPSFPTEEQAGLA